MPPRSITLAYTLHPTPPPPSSSSSSRSPLLSALEGINAQFPLTNLHWKPSTRTSLRTIQSADVHLIDLGEAGTLGREVGGSVLEWPLVNLCLITCENDEMYKSQTRSFIRDWLSLLSARRNSNTPLIVLVNTAASAATSGKNVFGRDKGVIAKLRTEFNTGKRDRCVQLNLPLEGGPDPAAWVEVINKLKESIVSAFDSAIIEREEEVKRGEAQRLTVGWNFCTWFLLKESLAHSFEGVNLNEDALVVYEELEASFLQVLKEQNLSWFGKLGATGSKDDSLPILDVTVKPYRELLQTSSISVFDFRVYVFARQAQLLGRLGRITEIAKRGQWFVASLTRRLRESEGDLAEYFIESWTYTACMDIVQNCDDWSRIDRPNGDYSGLVAYESARSELLDIARVQVERIGVACGHLPNAYPFAASSGLALATDDVLFESCDSGLSDPGEADAAHDRPSLSNQQLTTAIGDAENFQALYMILTKRAINAYEACGKANSVIRLRADLAALARHNEDWQTAYEQCRGLAKYCVEILIWDPIAEYALSGALSAHSHLALTKDEDWTNLALAYLRVTALLGSKGEELAENKVKFVLEVLDGLRETDVSPTVDNHEVFSIRLIGDSVSWGQTPDESFCSIEVQNQLPTPLRVGRINIQLTDANGELVEYDIQNIELKPGINMLHPVSSTSISGLYIVRTMSVVMGKINFAYPTKELGRTLRVQRNTKGPKMKLRMPHEISLDSQAVVVLEVHSGECNMKKSTVAIAGSQQDIQFDMQGAECTKNGAVVSENCIELGDVSPQSSHEIRIPYHGAAQTDWMRARMVLSYETTSGHTRSAIDVQSVYTGLPVTVNVQDFFRPDCLISHFTIASDGREHLRVASVRLDASNAAGYEVEDVKVEDISEVVMPLQPLSCLFKIRKTKGVSSSAPAVLRLVIRYISIEQEVRGLVDQALQGCSAFFNRVARNVLADRGSWLQTYVVTGKLGSSLEGPLHMILKDSRRPADSDTSVHQFLTALSESSESPSSWRTLEIPVDVPQKRLLTSVRFDQTSPDGMIYVGRAISMNVRLSTTYKWAEVLSASSSSGGDAKEKAVEGGTSVVFDVVANSEDWVVLGKKKGFYIAEPSSPFTQEIVLVPVRSGKLFLPSVHVQLVSPRYRPTNTIMNRRGEGREDGNGDRGAGGGGDDAGHKGEEESLTCETFVENAAEVVHVLPAKSNRTVVVSIAPREWDMERV